MRHYKVNTCLKGYLPGDDIAMTRDEMRRIDELQNREHLFRGQTESLIALQVGAQLVMNNAGVVQAHAQHSGVGRLLKCAVSYLSHAVQQMLHHVSTDQVITMSNNLTNATVTVSSTPTEQCVNVRQEDARVICRAAQYFCRHECLYTSQEAKGCPLRRSLDTVPGLPVEDDLVVEDCPYRLGGKDDV